MDSIPSELLLKIFSYLPGNDITNALKTTKRFHSIIESYPFNLQKIRCRIEARCDDTLKLVIQKSDSNKVQELPECLWNQLCRLEIFELIITGINDYQHDTSIEKLIDLLIRTKQQSFRIVTINNIKLNNALLAETLLSLISTSYIQVIFIFSFLADDP